MSELNERRRFRIDVIGTGTAVFVAVVGFLAIRNQLDIFGQVLGVSVIGFFVILWLGVFILPVDRSIRFPNLTVVTNKEDLPARKHMGELGFFVDRFHKMCRPDHMDTIIYPLASLRSRGSDFANVPYPNPIHVELLLIQIPKAFDLMKQNKATLAWGVEDDAKTDGPKTPAIIDPSRATVNTIVVFPFNQSPPLKPARV